MEIKTVSICIIAYNEERYIGKLFEDLVNQTYPKNYIEIILVDSNSSDETKNIMREFYRNYNELYLDIKILENYKKIQSSGWNIAIINASQEVIIRIDAHAQLPNDFIDNNIKCINSGEYICGGPRPNIIDGKSIWKKVLLSSEQSMFGSSIAPYRNSKERKYVKSVFHGAYRKEVFEKVGLFNENLLRTEDNELHYRMREHGYSICYDPCIVSYYQTRNTLMKMIKQKYLNGFWVGRTIYFCPKCISVYHFVPFLFLLSLIYSSIMCFLGYKIFILIIMFMYILTCLLITLVEMVKNKNVLTFFLPILFFLLHISYGVGTLVGIIKGFLNKLFACSR